jgi:hypothetical protein
MALPIPSHWKEKVRTILDSDDRKRIILRQRALRDWSDLFPDLFSGDLIIALSEALEQPDLVGNQIVDMDEAGEVYEFIFTYSSRAIYSKVNLCPDGTMIIIYSAHRPLKGEFL